MKLIVGAAIAIDSSKKPKNLIINTVFSLELIPLNCSIADVRKATALIMRSAGMVAVHKKELIMNQLYTKQ